MYFHGSSTRMEPGAILVPGTTRDIEYGCAHVYMTTDSGFSLTEAEETFGARTAREFAIIDAYYWGQDPGTNDGYVHVVEPLGPIELDPHYDVSPACLRTTSAEVIAVFQGPNLAEQIKQWESARKVDLLT